MTCVAVGGLYFAVTPGPEGEVSLGLVRIEKDHGATVDFSWWQRKGDSAVWPDTPTFEPYMPTGRVEKQVGVEVAESLLAVPVELTPASKKAYKPDAKSIADQSVRLSKACMTLLRAFLAHHRTDLINDVDSESEEESGEGSDS